MTQKKLLRFIRFQSTSLIWRPFVRSLLDKRNCNTEPNATAAVQLWPDVKEIGHEHNTQTKYTEGGGGGSGIVGWRQVTRVFVELEEEANCMQVA